MKKDKANLNCQSIKNYNVKKLQLFALLQVFFWFTSELWFYYKLILR